MAVDISQLRNEGNAMDVNLCLDSYKSNMNDTEVLDYIALVIARNMVNSVAFKGGWVMRQLLHDKARMTKDVDFSIENEACYAKIKKILTQMAEMFLKDGIIASYKIDDLITPTHSGGIKMYREDDSAIGVDVGLHSISYGVDFYSFNFQCQAFSVERMLSDKILAILSRKRFRRPKDLFDVMLLSQTYQFESAKILDCIHRRGVEPEWKNIPFSDEVIVQYLHAWDKLQVLKVDDDDSELYKPPFNETLATFYMVANKLKNIDLGEDTGTFIWKPDSDVNKRGRWYSV